MKAVAVLTAWLLLLAAAAAALTATAPSIEELARDPADTALSVARALHIVSAGMAWYLVIATSVSVAARTLQLRTLSAIADGLATPTVRLLVGSALGVSTLAPAAPALADHTPPTSVLAEEVPTMRLLTPLVSMPEAGRGDYPAHDEPLGDASSANQSSAVPSASVEVAPGDHLWGIAARHLRQVSGRTPTDAETARYWSLVVELNTPRLASGDPDLIRPGETVELPPLPANWAI